MKTYIRIFCVLLLSVIMGCGYTAGSLLPSHLKTIYIDSFINKIDISNEASYIHGYQVYRSGLESDVTRAIIDQFIFDGNLSVVDEERADLVLKGELIYYTQEPLRYDKFDNVEEYRVRVSVNMELEDTTKGSLLWKEHNFTGESTYRTSGTLAKSEESAIEEAVQDLAKRIVEKTTEGW